MPPLAAFARYAAGWGGPDVFNDEHMRRQFYDMWSWVAARYRWTNRIAGYEVMPCDQSADSNLSP